MPFLKSPADVAAAIGASSGGRAPTGNDPTFIAMLHDSTARIENILNTPLELSGHEDTFMLDSRVPRKYEILRLAAGFVDPASVTVINPFGEPANSGDYTVNFELGSVILDAPAQGRWVIRYNAGFANDGNDPAIFIDTPDWLRSLVDRVAVGWFRTVSLNPKISENVSYVALMSSVYRGIAGAVYPRYDRPRSPAIFPHFVAVIPLIAA
jgi:hypothetical protein